MIKSISGEINNQQDVIKCMNKIIRYYVRNEPSSPVPLMMHRAKKLVGKDFREIIREVAYSATSQIDELFGTEEINEITDSIDSEE